MAHLVKTLALDPKTPLLLTFDAFGTLYRPRVAIETIYAECARKHGLVNAEDHQVAQRFKQAFKQQRSVSPNYGAQNSSSSPFTWWKQIAQPTFANLEPNDEVFDTIFDDLWEQFGSKQAYRLQPHASDVFSTLHRLRSKAQPQPEGPGIAVGVVSNSDPRVSNILSSLGIRVHPKEATRQDGSLSEVSGSVQLDKTAAIATRHDLDIDFVVTSYEVGTEKPAPGIFAAAYDKAVSQWPSFAETHANMQMLHVGDDLKEDYEGAHKAGWKGILLDSRQPSSEGEIVAVPGLHEVDSMLKSLYSQGP